MVKFLKKNKIAILSFIILFVWALYVLLKDKLRYGFEFHDPILLFYHAFSGLSLSYLPIIAPLFIIIPSIWNFHKELNSGFIKNCLTRVDYGKYIKKLYLKALKNFWILPLFVVILLLLCCILLGNFDFGSEISLYGYYHSPNPEYVTNISIFMLVFLINIILHSIFYVNLSLLYCKKNSNMLINIILSYLTFIVIDIIMEIFVGAYLFANLLDIHYISDSVNLFVIWVYDRVISLPFTVIYSLALVIISSVVLKFIYFNRERTVIAIEK